MYLQFCPLKKSLNIKAILSFTFLLFGILCFGQINVTPNKANATYNSGESMNFNIISNSSGQVSWEIKYDNYAPVISSGTIFLSANQTKSISYTSSEPGIIICEVTKGNDRAVAAAAFSPTDIEPFEDEPSDFDSFWNGQKSALSSVPINPILTFFQNNTYSTTYRVRLNNINNRKVYGYLTIPNGAGPFPAVIDLPPFGSVPNLITPDDNLAGQAGVIVLSVSIHNVPPDQVDPNAYEPDNITNENQNYYRWGILGAVRAIDYLFTRSEFNGSDVGVIGVSQGAGLASIVAGVDNRVKLLAFSNPVLSQNSGLHHNRAGGFPNYIQESRISNGSASHEAATVDASRYYDAMFHARRYNGPVYANLSYEDLITPAATGFATLNQFSGKKILLHSTVLDHSHPVEYWVNRQDFIRRVFPSTLSTHPFPYSSNNQGYWIDAGNDKNISGNSTNLNASIQKNGSNNPIFNLKWKKISGPGNVSFSSSNSYNTNATFSSNGTYVLEFSGIDEAQLSSDKKYFTISDRITITVNGGSSGGGNNNGAPSVSLSTSSVNVNEPFVINVNASENINGFILSDINVSNGTATNLSGSGSNYSFTVSPIVNGFVSVNIPLFRVLDNQGNGNTTPSNTITVNYISSGGTGGGGGNNCNNPTNIALNKPTQQHSEQFNANSSRAVDGNTNGDFWGGNSVSLTRWTNNAWWEVDLQSVSDISQIKIWNRTDCCESALSQYHIFISDSPFNSSNVNDILNQTGVTDFFQSGIADAPSTININSSGRYVRIQLSGQGFLGLAEVEILGCSGTSTGGGGSTGGNGGCNSTSNIAPTGTATQSSIQFSGNASNAIDENTEGAFWNPAQSVSLTKWEQNPWWQIDLGTVSTIDEINIWNRTDCCLDKLKDYYILVSDSPFSSTNLNTTINQSGVTSFFQNTIAGNPSTIPINTTGRYIRIQLQDQGFLALAEVEIIGCTGNNINNNTSTLIAQPDILLFEADLIDREVQINWSTNTEKTNDHFILEKSSDGLNFEALAISNSRSNDLGFHFYDDIDKEPFLGKNYYRLICIQQDGTTFFSNIKELDFDIDLHGFSIFPNPAQEKLFINLEPFLEKNTQIQIFDARGVEMTTKSIENNLEPIQKIDMSNYNNGLYFIAIKIDGQKIITRQFVVARTY